MIIINIESRRKLKNETIKIFLIDGLITGNHALAGGMRRE